MKHYLLVALIAFSLFFIFACTDEPQAFLKVGSIQWPGYEPVFLAKKLGYYSPENVKLVELPSNTESLYLLRDGRLDAAFLTLDEALIAADMGTSISIILILDFSNGADVLMAKPSIQTLKDIQNQRIGVESGAVGEILLHAALDRAKLEKSDVQVVYLTADEHLEAYMEGKVDAVVTFEPWKTKLIQQKAHVLFDSSLTPNLIIDVLAVRTDKIKQQRKNIQMFVQGYYKARAYMEKHQQKAMQSMAPRLGTTAEDLSMAYQDLILPDLLENQRYFSGSPSPLERSVTRVAELMKKDGLLSLTATAKPLIDGSFVTGIVR